MKWHADELDDVLFPKLDKYLKNDFCKEIRKKERVWKSFKKYSGLDGDDALEAVDFGKTYPYLVVEELSGNGKFRKSKPKTIFIDLDIAIAFEDHPARLKRVVESTILHEMVHWARHNDGNRRTKSGTYRGNEAGKRFECTAYGGDVGMNRRTKREKLKTGRIGGSKYRKFECPTRRRKNASGTR